MLDRIKSPRDLFVLMDLCRISLGKTCFSVAWCGEDYEMCTIESLFGGWVEVIYHAVNALLANVVVCGRNVSIKVYDELGGLYLHWLFGCPGTVVGFVGVVMILGSRVQRSREGVCGTNSPDGQSVVIGKI